MIKFFRRIRQRLLSEKKITKYLIYAAGEIFLVVIGILIALQINNWNDHRIEGKKELAYLKRLQEDIQSDRVFLDENRLFYNQVFAARSLVLQSVEEESDRPVKQWDILVAYFHASQIWPIIPSSATFEELKSSGELSLLKNIDLRNTLPFYHGYGFKRYNETMGINPPYRKLVRGLIPARIQNKMWEHCHETRGDVQMLFNCKPQIEESEAAQINAQLAENKELISELRYYMSSIKVGLSTLTEQEKLNATLLEMIESEIENRQ